MPDTASAHIKDDKLKSLLPGKKTKSLREGHRRALGQIDLDENQGVTMPDAALHYYAKHPQLKNVPPYIVRKAWFTISHLLLEPGAHVADMGCGDGAMTYVMAVLNPQIKFTGVDIDEKNIQSAREKFKLPNLRYKAANVAFSAGFERDSYDGIINSFILHEVYSGHRYSDRQVARTLEQQFGLLRENGWMYVRDFALRRQPTEYVLIELPDVPETGSTDVATMSEPELLVWFSHNARPTEESVIDGFFLEELEPRLEKTRLFRLPYKWAYEFVVRKDNRAALQAEIHKEYVFFTEGDFTKALRALGARVHYHAPHWDDDIISKRFEGRFRLFDDEARPLNHPATSFILLAQKVKERTSLALHERRPSAKVPENLRVTPMINEQNGKIIDIVSRDLDQTEIIPYRVTHENQLHVFVHEGFPRGVVNAAPRNTRNLDGRHWSGHMVEAAVVPSHIVHEVDNGIGVNTYQFAKEYLGLKPAIDAVLEKGQSHYPAPDYIDEVVKTRYLRVREHSGAITPQVMTEELKGFSTTGRMREINAQRLLDAMSVGVIPNARLELQILSLYDKLKLHAETWEECPLVLHESDPKDIFDAKAHMKLKAERDDRFKAQPGVAKNLRPVQSTFVDEGWADGAMTGLASRDVEFIVSNEPTQNRAAILPLTKKSGQVMIGFEVDYLPVPQRIEGNGLTARAPTISLPKEVTSTQQARKYVADQFNVGIESVWRLGESYFVHSGLTAQRIFPFAVAVKEGLDIPHGKRGLTYAPMKYIYSIFNNFLWKGDMLTQWALVRARRRLGQNHDLGLSLSLGWELAHKPAEPAIMNVSSMSGVGGGGMKGASSAASGGGGKLGRALADDKETAKEKTDLEILEDLLGGGSGSGDTGSGGGSEGQADSLKNAYRSTTGNI